MTAALRVESDIYRASPTRRRRRTKAEMQALTYALLEIVESQQPMTVRQVFYKGVGLGYWDKTEKEYNNVVCRLLADLRREGVMPYGWIADGTRWMRKPRTFSSLEAALQHTAKTYRRALWDRQDTYLEVWLEKEALAGVIVDVTDPWDVPLMVTRGYPSLSFLHSAAETIKERAGSDVFDRLSDLRESMFEHFGREFRVLEQTKNVVIVYIGDHDPSGDDIARNVDEQLCEMSEFDIEFVRVAVTADQIVEYDLPTRPTKTTDTRAKKWNGRESVEVDAIDTDELRRLVETEIERHVDSAQLEVLKVTEDEEREWMRKLVEREFAS